jgi:hypothetical protein
MHARLPLWVIRVGPKQAEASPDARFAPKADKQADVSASLFCARTGREQMQHRVQVYSITSSARASNLSGTSRLRAFAVFRWITSSNERAGADKQRAGPHSDKGWPE